MTIPIAALAERQSWCREQLGLTLAWEGDQLMGQIATVGRDGDLAADVTEEAWVEAAVAGLPGISRGYGPQWSIAPPAWPEVQRRLGVWCSLRMFHITSPESGLIAQLSVELRGEWSVTLYWIFSPTSVVHIQIDGSGGLRLTGADPFLESLRAVTGFALEAPSPTHQRSLEIPRDRTNALFERLARWAPESLSWVHAAVSGKRPA